MARTIAALVRHGDYRQLPDTPSALQPFPLTALGEQQARQGGQTLRADMAQHGWVPAARVDSSRMLRAWQTARIIVRELADLLPGESRIESFDALAERSVGCAANLDVSRIEAILRDDPRFEAPPAGWKADSHYRLPLQGAESLLEAGRRVADHIDGALRELGADARRDTVMLFVGHGAAIRHAAHHLGVLTFDDIARLSMYHAAPVYLERHADGSWQHVGGEWKVRAARDGFTD